MKIEIKDEPCGQRDTRFSRMYMRFDHAGKRHVITSSIFHDNQPPQTVAEELREVAKQIDAIVRTKSPPNASFLGDESSASWERFVEIVNAVDRSIRTGAVPLVYDPKLAARALDPAAPLFEIAGYVVYRR